MPAPRRRFRWGFVVLAAVLVVLLGLVWMFSHQPAKPQRAPGVPVTVVRASLADVPVSVDALGSAQAWKSDLINTQVNGMLTWVAAEGANVKAGQPLAQIDPGPYRAALTTAEGALRRDQAVLAGAEVNLARFQALAAQDSIAKQQVDDQAALVKQDQGAVELDRGQVATAQLNLRYTRIVSPIDGRVCVRLVDPGNIVNTSLTTGIVSVNQISPIAVTFTVPQGDFQHLAQVSDGFRRPLPAVALSQETGQLLGEGEVSIVDNHVDPSTATVELKARFPNDAATLWPGQFVNVRLTLQTLSRVVTIPAAAVNEGPNGSYVYLVGPGEKAVMRPVVVATTQNNLAVITQGVRAGDLVVTDGQMTLRNGMPVLYHGVAAGAGP
ncbi:MAG TPA: efflux RND transporter periplasmic adaptor subunit [Caulobacteraceae bacterium]|nr:efflux RND transporter periplasmic adaptor subunit [Caulobacteraceae bacterium]